MTKVYEEEQDDFCNFWEWWLELEKHAREIVEPDEDGTKSLALSNQMMLAAYAAVKWEKHKDEWWNGVNERIQKEKIEKLEAQLREKGREVSKLKARLKRRKGSKAKAKGVAE